MDEHLNVLSSKFFISDDEMKQRVEKYFGSWHPGEKR
jgi:hypothetical protein